MSKPLIPLIILGGTDHEASQLPPSGKDKHPLVGYKGLDLRINGRCLVDVLVDRMEQSGAFAPIIIAGPSKVYKQAGIKTMVVDTDGTFGDNIQAGIKALRAHYPHSPIAITTIDILPKVKEVHTLLEDYYANEPHDVWFPSILVPEDYEEQSAFAWKPKYRIAPSAGEQPRWILPGHLMIIDPDALRLDFMVRLFQIAYRTRNKPIEYRKGYMIRQLIWGLLAGDIRNIFRLRLPNLTWSVVSAGINSAAKLKAGTATRQELEGWSRMIFVKTRHRKKYPERGVSLPQMHALSLAEDIDTEEEARARGAVPKLVRVKK